VNEGKATLQFDETIMRKLWDNYYVPYIKGYYTQEGRYRTDDIKLGNVLAIVCSSAGTAYFPTEVTTEEKTYPIEAEVLPLPNFEGTDSYAIQQGANIGVVKSDETHEYASVVFLEWLTQTEQNLKLAIASSYLPVTKEASTEKAYDDYVEKNNVEVDSIINDTFHVALTQIENSTMYKENGFIGAYEARNILGSTLLELAQKDRSDIVKQIAKGKKEEEVLSPYLTDDYFKAWYEDTKASLSEYCN
jgi:multiple sugar transport system substrate-binding protein